jgi:glutamate-ammonia-ligase adenylyltransferase
LQAGQTARQTAQQVAAGGLDAADSAALLDAAGLCWTVQSAAQLVVGGGLNMDKLGEGGLRFILRETGADDLAALAQHMADVSARASAVIDRLVGNVHGKG